MEYEIFKEKFDKLVKNSRRVVITAHTSPDDDSISSVLIIHAYLTSILKLDSQLVKIIYTGIRSSRWNYFKNYEQVDYVDDLVNHITSTDLLIILDSKVVSRISQYPEKLQNLKLKTICIDHHKSDNPDDFDLYLSYPQVKFSSNAELLYTIFLKDYLKNLDRELCEIILLGILGDTGNFRFINKESLSAFGAATELIYQGDISLDELRSKYEKIPQRNVEIFSKLLNNLTSVKIPNWPRVYYSFLDLKSLEGYNKNDLSGGSKYFIFYFLKQIEGVEWGFIIKPSLVNDEWSVTFVSTPGSVNVRIIAEALNGGGHDGAAGGKFISQGKVALTYEDCLNSVFDYLKTHKPVFIGSSSSAQDSEIG